jgi:2-methylcitrate dehydratase PrpD
VQFFHSGSTVKRIHAAQAASSGVRAALLVNAGFSGPEDILEGETVLQKLILMSQIGKKRFYTLVNNLAYMKSH